MAHTGGKKAITDVEGVLVGEFIPMRGQMGNMGWTGRDAGPHHHWWRRASAPAILTYLKAHRYYLTGSGRWGPR